MVAADAFAAEAAAADVVVTLGREAHVDEVPGTAFETWDTDEPSERGIAGIERMRLVRDDIARRVDDLAYGVGVWKGVVAERELGPITPRFTSWPGRTPAVDAR